MILVWVLLFLGCKTSKIELSSLDDVKYSLEYLASDELGGRDTGGEGIEKAAFYIENAFNKHGIDPYFETYRDSFNVDGKVGYNIVGILEGSDSNLKNEFVILGAHYDHIGIVKPIDGDSIANGANDDATGTVAVLEWAKYFSKANNNKRSILFTLYSAEEMGLKGSEHLAKRLKDSNLNLYTMINIEMVGVPFTDEKMMAFVSGYEKSNIAQKLNYYTKKNLVGLYPLAQQYGLFKRSDNYPFYNEFKIPAHAISTCDITDFKYYHHVDDEADKMNFAHMTSFINEMIPALVGMINAPFKEIILINE